MNPGSEGKIEETGKNEMGFTRIISELEVEACVSPLIQNTAPAESFTRFHRFLQFANDWGVFPLKTGVESPLDICQTP